MIAPRPSSLAEVARRVAAGSVFSFELADFLHEFSARGTVEMLTEEPELLTAEDSDVQNAYLAAAAAFLAARLGEPAPRWTRKPERVLPRPWFAMPGKHMRALLLVESPAAFRERNLFVSANALSVA